MRRTQRRARNVAETERIDRARNTLTGLLAQYWRKDKDRPDLRVHRHLLAQAHAERRVDLERLLFDGDVLFQGAASLQQTTQGVLQLTKFLLELTDRLVYLVHLRLQPGLNRNGIKLTLGPATSQEKVEKVG